MNKLACWTPTLRSAALTEVFGAPVFLKMECHQPTGSFKIRGLGDLCSKEAAAGARQFISSSGGNAGLAVAYAGARLNIPTTVFVPSLTSQSMRKKIEREGAKVVVKGEVWDDAHKAAVEASSGEGTVYIHPFDHPDIWAGHRVLIEETARDLAEPPGSVVVAVGGGGLLCGVLEGMHRVGWEQVPVLAVETEGAASYAAALKAGAPVTLDSIRTIAITLGARRVADRAVEWRKQHPISCWRVSDRQALDACFRFASDHRVLVEPACGAALAAVYGKVPPLERTGSVLVIVCGGAGVSLEQMSKWNLAVG